MRFMDWRWVKGVKKLLSASRPEPVRRAERIVAMQLHSVLPAKAGLIAVVVYYLFYSRWFSEVSTTRQVVQEAWQRYFLVYVLCNVVATGILILSKRFRPGLFPWLVLTLGLLAGLFMAGLIFITFGFESMAYWVFP